MLPRLVEVTAVVQRLALDCASLSKAIAPGLTVFRWEDGRCYREPNRKVGRKIYIGRWAD